MAEYSRQYSKSVAFDPSTYPDDSDPGSGSKLIKVGEKSFWYDPEHEDENSAMPKKDIEALIGTTITGLDTVMSMVTDVTIIDGVVRKRTRKFTFENGVLKAVSAETPWS
jgi:hypothetical protein